jgi:HSP20 family protein
MYERDGKLMVTADLPGVNKEDVKVEVDQDAIVIQGQRRQEQSSQERGYYRSERSYGSFYRTIPLPEGVDSSTANATFRNGVLQITLQVPQKRSTSRSLEIKDEEQGAGGMRSGGADTPQRSGSQQR